MITRRGLGRAGARKGGRVPGLGRRLAAGTHRGAEATPSVDKSDLHFRWDGKEIAETFNASEEALTALARLRYDPDSSPPWEYASELLADGLIDVHFDLTPRGKRALASR